MTKNATYCDKHVSSRKCIFFVVIWVGMSYYCWHHPLGEYAGRRNYKPLSFYVSGWDVLLMGMRWVLAIIEDYMMVEYVDLPKGSDTWPLLKTWCKMDVSTPPSLDVACPQAKTKIEKHVHMLRERGVDKTKYGHRSIMYIIIIATNFIIELLSHNVYHKLLMNK